MMKDVDGSIELVACGSCSPSLPTYMEWDRQVLEYVGDLADYISLHRYVGNREDSTPDYLAVTNAIDRQIEETDAVCRFVQAKRRGSKRAYLCFDEWNVWYKNQEMDGAGKVAPRLIEEIYNLEDALVVAGFLNSFIRHADVVKIANIAQIVNVIAPIQTRGDELLIQSIFYPFEMFSQRRHGLSLRPVVEGPGYTGDAHGQATFIDASAIWEGGQLHVFLTNRSIDQSAPVRISLADGEITSLQSGEILTASDAKAANSFEAPDVVRSVPFDAVEISQGEALLGIPPLSLVATTFRLA
jgi:alpha-N-arabinofuranosidase